MLARNGAHPIAVGIDFGTTNSVVAFAMADGRVESMSWEAAWSAVPNERTATFRSAMMFWRENGKVAHAAGPEAIARALTETGEQRFIQSIKTHLASRLFTETRLYGQRFTVEQLVSAFLNDLFQDGGLADEEQKQVRLLPAVGGRPVVFAGERPDETLAMERLQRAFGGAGFETIDFAYEPLGAAYWYGRGLDHAETILVADFGGGTSDFSVLRFAPENGRLKAEPLAHSGVGVAGDTFDYRILDHVIAPRLGKGSLYRSFDKRLPIPAYFHAAFAQWHQLSWLKSPQTLAELRKLQTAAEAPAALDDLITLIECDLGFELHRAVASLKAELSSMDKAIFSFKREGIAIEAEVARKDFETWIAPDIAALAEAMETALTQAQVKADAIDAVFLTGGTSYVPAVRGLFVERFGEKRVYIGDAFQSVASGLALLAADRIRADLE
ncbi:Hsp70 family protein [Beijerinckia mobilis]|uniref:Hsp70 family protein n=1 Tax=Beijerinckia mobilis TaxID=231434 RepID=UPI00054E7DC7|nr:Hsp70 family protein [Beijerinckia mobilis]